MTFHLFKSSPKRCPLSCFLSPNLGENKLQFHVHQRTSEYRRGNGPSTPLGGINRMHQHHQLQLQLATAIAALDLVHSENKFLKILHKLRTLKFNFRRIVKCSWSWERNAETMGSHTSSVIAIALRHRSPAMPGTDKSRGAQDGLGLGRKVTREL